MDAINFDEKLTREISQGIQEFTLTDYEQWKQWFKQWNVNFEEKTWNPNEKELVIGGIYCQASVVFDLNENFICVTAYE